MTVPARFRPAPTRRGIRSNRRLGAMRGRGKAREMLGEAGGGRVGAHGLDHDFQHFLRVARREAG